MPVDVSKFPFLAHADERIKRQFTETAMLVEVPEGGVISWEGDQCNHLAMVISGVVRVYKVGENGREITLYRIGAAESCILTASCILNQADFPAIAVAEEPVEAVLIPAMTFRNWVGEYEFWRNYVFGMLSQRLGDVITTVEEVTFRRLGVRIAEFLLKQPTQPIRITHQELASELGSAREVVSRILKDFERAEIVSLGRGTITIEDIDALEEKTTLA